MTSAATVADSPPPYGLVVFDCDSTLASIEGIEELAAGGSPELQRLTAQAMDGGLPLEEAYGARLELVQPTREQVAAVGGRYIATALPHARELVLALRALGKRVAIVSGGLLPPVRALGAHLGVAAEEVHAVDISFDAAGGYADFDRSSPLARSGGKPELLRRIAAGTPTALVGDGATDLEAAPVVQRFVAFGGVVRREKVFAAARVSSVQADLAALVPLLLAPDEIAQLRGSGEHSQLMDAADAAL